MTESVNTELRIAVIGAGPAGVYSSDIFLRQLKKLGEELGLGTEARIDLFEKLPVPFGLVRYGVAPDHPSIKFIASALEKTLDNPDIHLYCDVEFGKDVTLDELLERYDAVLFATAAVQDKPLGLPGADLDGVYGAAKFVEWYDGYPTGAREWPLEAEEVAVIGGGMVGCEVADFLGELGHEVSVIELRDQLGPDVIPEHRKFLMKDFEAYKVQGVTGAKVAQFFTDGVSYTLADGTEGRLEGFDNVVLAMGYRNNDTISEEIKKIVAETYVIGDAVKARKALDATAEGLNAALEI